MRLPGDPTVYRFILVGIINTLFGTAIMFVFYNVFHLSYWISSASNYFFGSILSYFLNKSFTFRYGRTDLKSILKFTVNVLLCYLLTSRNELHIKAVFSILWFPFYGKTLSLSHGNTKTRASGNI